MSNRKPWSHDERLLAFRLYCSTQFGKLHHRNPSIIALAELIGRTPSAVAMKACNFASLDPVQHSRNIVALGNASQEDRNLWETFIENPEAVGAEAEELAQQLNMGATGLEAGEFHVPEGPTEVAQLVRTRRVQFFFRNTLLVSYENRCAVSEVNFPALLNASHIVPWNVDVKRRADPRNGILLNVLLDRAFDRGLVTFDESLRLVVAKQLKCDASEYQRRSILSLEGTRLRSPVRFEPDMEALAFHRENVFMDT